MSKSLLEQITEIVARGWWGAGEIPEVWKGDDALRVHREIAKQVARSNSLIYDDNLQAMAALLVGIAHGESANTKRVVSNIPIMLGMTSFFR